MADKTAPLCPEVLTGLPWDSPSKDTSSICYLPSSALGIKMQRWKDTALALREHQDGEGGGCDACAECYSPVVAGWAAVSPGEASQRRSCQSRGLKGEYDFVRCKHSRGRGKTSRQNVQRKEA